MRDHDAVKIPPVLEPAMVCHPAAQLPEGQLPAEAEETLQGEEVSGTELTVDKDGRISLKWRKQRHGSYFAEEAPDGKIILTPSEPEHARLGAVLRSPLEDAARRIPSRTEIQERARETQLYQERA
jgi:hypothetical protein